MYFGLVPQFLSLLLCISLVHCSLVIKPQLLIAEAYHDAFFLCQIDSSILSAIWTLPSGEVVRANKTSTDNRFRNSGGFLFISNVSFADRGDYECSIDENTSSVGVLEVFVMPSYTLDLSLVFLYDIRRLVLRATCTHQRFNSSISFVYSPYNLCVSIVLHSSNRLRSLFFALF
ncbi:Immunoglobulin subtype [Echinococcus multilocularis]|uniref:Immunoglobulin subtype n=1 Tax=Echinococcus multilocularis TaxID=6211 RepID=A0A068XUK4_ECHMU|nr:Immunoglobulin subtype [Echinococcus multilocularis]